MSKRSSVFIHIVTWNSADVIEACIEHAAAQSGYILGADLFIRITDNASSDDTVQIVERCLRAGITLTRNRDNLGFCAAHNQGVSEFLVAGHTALLILNPDVGLAHDCLKKMAQRFSHRDRVGLVTPKLLRALTSLEPIHPAVLDAAGMRLTWSCRHFDRGAGEWDRGQFNQGQFVFGGTGACLLLSRECVEDLIIPRDEGAGELFLIYPALKPEADQRRQLFDEAFFAYREDADLSWRARNRGWRCWYEPSGVATHVRVVTPERRKQLPDELNRYGVRNRFLLQINNWRWSDGIALFLGGIIGRNLVVALGVFLTERSSIAAFRELALLKGRALRIRRFLRLDRG
jgi:GT2 family glycosyltransferase